MRQHALLIGFGLALTLFFVGGAAHFYSIPLSRELDAISYDYRLRLTMPGKVDDRIVILDIDEKSLKEEGRWPWSRDRMARLMDQLFDHYKVAVAGFDVVFAEKDESSGLKVLRKLEHDQLRNVPQFRSALDRLAPKLEYDRIFADKLKNRNVVLGYYVTNSATGSKSGVSGVLPDPVFPPGTFKGRNVFFTHWDGYGGNLPELQKNAASAGHFNPIIDFDDGYRVQRCVLRIVVAGDGAHPAGNDETDAGLCYQRQRFRLRWAGVAKCGIAAGNFANSGG